MQPDDLTALIRERRRQAECLAAGIPYVPDARAPGAGPDGPDVLLPANPPLGPPPAPRELPGVLRIHSPAHREDCAAGEGFAEAAYADVSEPFYLDDLETLTRTELYRIAPAVPALQEVLDQHLESLVAGSVTGPQFDDLTMGAAGLEPVTAVEFRERALEVRENLYQLVRTIVLGQLVCTFYNPDVWVLCDSGEDVGYRWVTAEPDELPASDAYQFRPAGDFPSRVGQADATALAVEDALGALTCVYLNEPQTVTCGPAVDSVAHISPIYADNSATGSNYIATPFVWQANAYTSLEALATAGFSAPSLDSLSVPNALVYRVTEEPSAAHAAPTQAAANERARAAALRRLKCFYPSRGGTVDCSSRAPVYARMQALGSPEAPVDKTVVFAEMDSDFATDALDFVNVGLITSGGASTVDARTGFIVDMPPGLVTSATSQEAADEAALQHANGFLSCVWLAPRTACSCTDAIADPVFPESPRPAGGTFRHSTSQLEELEVHLSESQSSSYFVEGMTSQLAGVAVYAKGELGSSEAGPVTDALDLCKASLVCVFCNDVIAPRCTAIAPASNLYTEGTTPLPLSLSSAQAGVSSSITAGMAADTVCDYDPETVRAFALATATLPPLVNNLVAGEPDCQYGNDLILAACRAADLTEEVILAHTANGVAPLTVSAAVEWAAYFSSHSTAGVVSVAKDTFQAASRIEANEIAQTIILSQLDCFFESPALRVFCGAATGITAASIGAPAFREAFTGYELNPAVQIPATGDIPNVHPLSKGTYLPLQRPVTTKYGYGHSYVSPQDALDKALLIALGQLDCFYKNTTQTGVPCCGKGPDFPSPCVDGDITIRIGRVAANQYTSYISQADANTLAKVVADSLTACAAREDFDIPDAPGEIPEAILLPDKINPFGSSGSGSNRCCKVTIDVASVDSKFFDLADEEHPLEETENELAGTGKCAPEARFIYLEAALYHGPGAPPQEPWRVDNVSIKAYTSEQSLLTPEDPKAIDSVCRRLIAQTNGGHNKDCSDLQLVQSVTCAQALMISYRPDDARTPYPIIVDRYTPKPPPRPGAFEMKSLMKVEGGFELYLGIGWVREIIAKGAAEGAAEDGAATDAIAYWVPKGMYEGSPIRLKLQEGDYVYVNYKTDKAGNITEDPELVVTQKEEDSAHYQPVDEEGAGGAEGSYKVVVGQLVGKQWIPYTNGFIDHYQELWTGKNLGEGSNVFKKRNAEENTYEFRSLKGRYGILEEATDEEIKLDLAAENVGGGVEVLLVPEVADPPPTVPTPLPDAPAQFRTLRALGAAEEYLGGEYSAPQIRVTAEDAVGATGDAVGKATTIRIRGNGKNGALIFVGCDGVEVIHTVEWVDGLIITAGDKTIEVGCDGTGSSASSSMPPTPP